MVSTEKKKYIFMNKQGFTLVEVMVASLILFSAISCMSLIFKSFITYSQKFNHTLIRAESISGIKGIIKDQLENKKNDDEIFYNDNLYFSYRASLIYSYEKKVSSGDPFIKKNSVGRIVLAELYGIELKLIIKDQGVDVIKEYEYKETLYIEKQGY